MLTQVGIVCYCKLIYVIKPDVERDLRKQWTQALKEYKSIEKEKKVIRLSMDNLKFSSDDSDNADKGLNKTKRIGHYSLNVRRKKYTRMLVTVKDSAVNAVVPIHSII